MTEEVHDREMASKSMKQSKYLHLFCNFNFNSNPLTHQRFSRLDSTREKSTIGLRQLVRSFSTTEHVNLDKLQVLLLKIFNFFIWVCFFATLDEMGIVQNCLLKKSVVLG